MSQIWLDFRHFFSFKKVQRNNHPFVSGEIVLLIHSDVISLNIFQNFVLIFFFYPEIFTEFFRLF